MKPPKDVDEYIASCPKEHQGRLKKLRALIKAAAPGAQEKISYGMPYYGYKGRLIYFQLWKKHLGLYIPPPIIGNFEKEIKGYATSKATVRFPLDEKLPTDLIRRLVKAAVKKNEEAEKK